MHPVLKEGVSIGTFQYEGSDITHYYIENADGKEFEISYRLWNALLQADGTRPLNLPDNGSLVLPKLKRLGLVRTSRFVRDDGIFNRFILFPVGVRSQKNNPICMAINAALPVVSTLIFATGIYLVKSSGIVSGYYFNWWLYFGLLVCSLALHEVGHLVAGLAYGYEISDIGILLLGVIPIGAYVAYEGKKDASKFEKAQFALAGVEMNLLIAGICLLMAMQYYSLSLVLLTIANINVVFAGINLLPALGLDGESALSAVYGVNSISKVAKKCLFNKKRRQKLLRSGFSGYAYYCVLVFTMISRVIFWLFIGLDFVTIFFNLF